MHDNHLIEDNSFNSITYHPPELNKSQKIASGTVKGVSEKYVLMKNETGFSVYRRLDLNRNYTVGQKIGGNGEILDGVADSVNSSSVAKTNTSTVAILNLSNRTKP